MLVRTLHHADRFVFEATNGRRTASSLLTGLPIVMLITTGAKSGKKRTLPLLGIPDGEDIIVVASGYGQTKYPAWYHNLRANPEARIYVEGMTRDVRAREAEGVERERLWRRGVKVFPGWDAFQQRASNRRIPVIILSGIT
ncbi:MAG: nitroreductase family deazaflavin-dependent oxidoreductase [Rubrobacter sp.]|nr:nitroreductase family deazaflavin-dependent oxidoreductase [Rubrobacter sp.]MBA3790438.1 nitroreductase family deazaflavin-dependent oxidoreductase [Rubrobacter sp.]